ncbi:MAG: exodeoxyribonuclease VII large subunit [Arachnia propionica]|uniref:exodeoxyribonuclease VII large subunit n=1 Tax=Arachnia propionica TaxID=1750 RepID=UPI002700DABE|nr:exodeoxyribonuclease VII large subunit [Arachnia propionica]
MAMSSSPESPQALSRVVGAVADWVGRLGEIWVSAQVIEIKRRSYATQFLTLRDRTVDISCSVTTTAFVLDAAGPIPEGSEVIARLRPRVWERSGSLNFECLELQVAGTGRLLAELDHRRRALQAEGLFDPHRKRPVPFLPRRIGLITGKGSDAERDVLRNTRRRWPAVFEIEHTLVQGPQAATQIITALRHLDEHPEVDVIVIARGGGSLEDLLPFSDEGLVRAVAACRTPVVSAIGHESDAPLIDFAADLRASTPTDAAARIVPELDAEEQFLTQARQRLQGAVETFLQRCEQELAGLRARPVLASPLAALSGHTDRLALLRLQLRAAVERRLAAEQSQLDAHLQVVRALSPQATLQRGYSLLTAGTTPVTAATARVGETITAHLADGELDLKVTATRSTDE